MNQLTLYDKDMGELLSKIDEYKRKKITDAEVYDNFKYIDPNSHISNIGSHNNNIVFGRRGSGKTSLVIAAINRIRTETEDVYIKYDFQNFRNKRYEKVILEITNKAIKKIIDETSIFNKLVFENHNLRKSIKKISQDIQKSLLHIQHEKSSISSTFDENNKNVTDLQIGGSAEVKYEDSIASGNLKGSAEKTASKTTNIEEKTILKSTDDFLHVQNLETIQSQMFNIINIFSKIYNKKIILFFDDFYQIKKNIHPYILEYFHTISKECINNSFCFKVCALPDSIKYNFDGENTFSLKDDYTSINVDHNLDRLTNQTDYLLDILSNLCENLNIKSQDIRNLFVSENLTHCILGAGGLPRDFMILFSDSVKKAKKNNNKKITAEDVYSAILDLALDKEEKSKLDSEIDTEKIKMAIATIQLEVVDGLKTNVILYPYTKYEHDIKLLRELENLRYIHSIRDTIKDKNKNTFHPYLIDMSFCVTQRTKKSGLKFNKFWVHDDARTLDNLRKAPVWNFTI
ncbi:MAG: hypothetical protein GQ570_15400 [Helicobacteraceae bacterium]|nr:hypothetical protein [Helicobacteraceae bacterium]